jgi:UDPglucose 6-dehydrogenase
MKVAVFGIGYVGLVQAAVFAEVGHQVFCVDRDEARIAGLVEGVMPIYEPGLAELVEEKHAQGLLRFSTDAAAAIAHADVIMIAVGTPPAPDGSADVSHVLNVARTIGRHMDGDKIVVTKSTVPVGTGDAVAAAISAELAARGRGTLRFEIVSNPEFQKEGSAVADCQKPDRIVIGCETEAAEAAMRELYAPFARNHERFVFMDVRSAELTKYAANCMLATKISFMNEIAGIAERMGADIEQVRLGIGSDPRIGYHFIYPGLGYGGSCFPKDISALIGAARAAGFEPSVLEAVESRNRMQKSVLFERVRARFQGKLAGRTFALWGLSFKPNTDDMREAPSRVLMEALWAEGATVRAYDPHAMDECRAIYGERGDLVLCASQDEALAGADALMIATEWKRFRTPSFDAIREALTHPVIFDGRNLYEPDTVARHGLEYHSIGRAPVMPRRPAARDGIRAIA